MTDNEKEMIKLLNEGLDMLDKPKLDYSEIRETIRRLREIEKDTKYVVPDVLS